MPNLVLVQRERIISVFGCHIVGFPRLLSFSNEEGRSKGAVVADLSIGNKLVVVALGGNALGETPEEQIELTKNAAKHIVDMVVDGARVVVTHGNGPQVGMISNAFAVASADAAAKVASMDFPECGALSQGYIGYHIAQAITNELSFRGIEHGVANLSTQTVVAIDDPAFSDPTKPIGAFMTEEEARDVADSTGYAVREDAGRGWRRVVASPRPQRIVEFDAIRSLVDQDYIVVAVGGGGIPVIETEQGYRGIPAVIDKDASAALLARMLGADTLVILTAVEKVCMRYGKPDQSEIDAMSTEYARALIDEGEFPAGSMLPKVEACIGFVEEVTDGSALITSLERAAAGLRGETGTVIRQR